MAAVDADDVVDIVALYIRGRSPAPVPSPEAPAPPAAPAPRVPVAPPPTPPPPPVVPLAPGAPVPVVPRSPAPPAASVVKASPEAVDAGVAATTMEALAAWLRTLGVVADPPLLDRLRPLVEAAVSRDDGPPALTPQWVVRYVAGAARLYCTPDAFRAACGRLTAGDFCQATTGIAAVLYPFFSAPARP